MIGRRVVVTGMGMVSPVGHTVEESWDNILAGKSGAAPIETFDVSAYNTRFSASVRDFDISAYLTPKESRKMDVFVQYGMAGAEIAPEVVRDEITLPEPEPVSKDLKLKERMALPISDLDLSVRAGNCLEAENIKTIGDLVRLTEADLLAMKNFGKTSLREVEQKLGNVGLSFDLDADAPVGS